MGIPFVFRNNLMVYDVVLVYYVFCLRLLFVDCVCGVVWCGGRIFGNRYIMTHTYTHLTQEEDESNEYYIYMKKIDTHTHRTHTHTHRSYPITLLIIILVKYYTI